MTYPFHVDPRRPDDSRDELAIQVLFQNRIRTLAPAIKLVGVPNAGRRSAWEKRQRSKEGLTPGFPDMIALSKGRTAYLEFKAGTGSLSPAQVDQLNWLQREGFDVGVFRSPDTAVEWLHQRMPDAFIGRIAA